MENKHAKFSPSQLHRLLSCPASYLETIRHGREGKPSVYAEEGTMLHDCAEKLFKDPGANFQDFLTNDQIDVVEKAVDYTREVVKQAGGPSPDVFMETEIKVSPEMWGLPDSYGTADVLLYNINTKYLYVIDYKFGAGVFVSVVNNPQFFAYGAGGLARFPEAKKVFLHVNQPRLENYDFQEVDSDFLKSWCKETAEKLKRCLIVPAEYNPSTETCRWCAARYVCVARIDWLKSITDDFTTFAKNVKKAPIEKLVELHKQSAEIKKAINEIGAYLLAKATSGVKVPTMKLVQGKATRFWKDPKRVQLLLEAMLGEDAYAPKKLISPAQLEKIDKSYKKDKSIIDLWDKKISYKLVDENHRAKEVPAPNPTNEEFLDFED